MSSNNPKYLPHLLTRSGLSILSGLLLGLSLLYANLFVIAWFAFIPLLFALKQTSSLKQAYWHGLLTGFSFYATACYWMTSVFQLFTNLSGIWALLSACLYWFYCAQAFAITTWLLNRFKLHIHPVWLFPFLVTIVFEFYPSIFATHIGETQSQFLVALQAIEYTGTHGLNFMIALANALLFFTITKNQPNYFHIVTANVILFAWFIFGIFSLSSWDGKTKQFTHANIGLIQPNIAVNQSKQPMPGYSKIYPIEMALTEQILPQKPDIIIWPERSNRDFYLDAYVKSAYEKRVRNWQTPLVFQDYEININQQKPLSYSTVTLLNKDGEISAKSHKTLRIPFAEYIPFAEHSVKIKNALQGYMSKHFSALDKGEKPQSLQTRAATIAPFVCYEGMFPDFVANSVSKIQGANLLIILSNNNWFGKTQQPHQQLASTILRSVENRLPLVHVVNNGPSGIILPSGRQLLKTSILKTAAYTVKVPISQQPVKSLYTRHPYWFFYLITSFIIIMVICNFFVRKKHRGCP